MPPATRRIAFATSAELAAIQDDDAGLAAALRDLGVEPVSAVWNDPGVDWRRFDAILIRTIWDYFRHYAAYLAWLDRLDALGVPTINATATLRWNSDKHYLLELARHGAPIIPTRLVAARELPAVLAAVEAGKVVVKPAVSGGAWHTVVGIPGDPAFAAALAELPPGADYLVQPFLPEVVDAGEWSLLYLDGRYSHAVVKRPARGDYRVQHEHGGSIAAALPDAATRAAADHVLAAAAALGHGRLAYARVDGIVHAGRFLLMELELVEPYLYLAGQPDASAQLARGIVRRLASAAARRGGSA